MPGAPILELVPLIVTARHQDHNSSSWYHVVREPNINQSYRWLQYSGTTALNSSTHARETGWEAPNTPTFTNSTKKHTQQQITAHNTAHIKSNSRMRTARHRFAVGMRVATGTQAPSAGGGSPARRPLYPNRTKVQTPRHGHTGTSLGSEICRRPSKIRTDPARAD